MNQQHSPFFSSNSRAVNEIFVYIREPEFHLLFSIMRTRVIADTPTVKDFAVAFVNAVSRKSDCGIIAKNGSESLFYVMSQIFPNVSSVS